MKLKSTWMCVCLMLLTSILSITTFAQQSGTATIEGIILDANQAVVPKATVTVRNTDTGLTRDTVTDTNGLFRIPSLPPGNYSLSAKASGFAETKLNGISVLVGQKLNLDVTIKVAAVGETVEISSAAPIVETTRASVSAAVNSAAVSNLPVNGRNFLDFVTLTPGVVRDPRGGDLSFGGQKGTLNSVQIDGVDNNNNFFGQSLGRTGSGRAPYQFSQDAVQEFQVNTNTYSAELGRAAGGLINVVTKSGTNEFHGSAFEFYRDRSLNANSLVADASRGNAMVPNFGRLLDSSGNITKYETKPSYHFNQFGGTIGGPIKKDKGFFFFTYDGQRNVQPNIISLAVIPPITGDTAPAATLSGYNQLLPFAGNYTRGFNQDVFLAKGDWYLTEKHRFNVRYNRQNFTGTNLENSGSASAQEHTGNSLVTTDTITFTLNSSLSPRILNEFRYQYGRDMEPGAANTDKPEAVIRQNGLTVLNIGRNNFSPRETTEKKNQFIDNVSLAYGKHSVKTGVDFNIERIFNYFPGLFGAQYNFNSYADYFNGKVASFTQAFAGDGTTGATTYPNFNEYSAYVQDDWRITRNLNLSLGLRYDAQVMTQGSTRNAAAFAAGIDTSLIHNDMNNFAPRFGFAWTPMGDKLVIRGGFGQFYGRTPSIAIGTALSNNGINVASITLNNPTGLVYPFRFSSLADIQAKGGVIPPAALFVFEKNYSQPYTLQSSLGVEYALSKDVSVSASYLSVKGRHLQRTRDINLLAPVAFSTISTSAVQATFFRNPGVQGTPDRPISAFSKIREFESNAFSDYNALSLQVNKRFAKNFQLMASYTWSKVIDNAPDATSVVDGNAGDEAKQAQQSFNLLDDKAVGNADVPHRFVTSGVWDLNYFKGVSKPLGWVVGGWQISSILQAQNNQPFSLVAGADVNNDSQRNSDRAPGIGRNTFRKGKFVSLDSRFQKTVNLNEKMKLQFVAEFFNILNHVNFRTFQNQPYNITIATSVSGNAAITTRNPAVSLVSRTDFGDPRSTADPRIGQLALKFIF